ncbi:MAG: OmpA family protein [Acidobacteria bacterium]|nr:MAG: OmpA family protein [Acidobacteriota bacterium]
MFKPCVPVLLIAFFVLPLTCSAQTPLKDFAGNQDPALFSRLPNYFLPGRVSVLDKEFDSFLFTVKPGREGKQAVEGHFVTYHYVFDKTRSTSKPSALQIIRNYQNAAARVGGKVLHEDQVRTTILITKNGQETWVEVTPVMSGQEYWVKIVERQEMKQDVVASAETFKNGLAESGHVEVPGIYFDTGKAEVKPESEPSLQEVVKLLQQDTALKVWVVGHTDYTGSEASNVTLSGARAAAVVKVLTQKMGVDATRLSPYGAGPYAPVSQNDTEEGRAKNRRVELVKKP